MSIRKSIHGAEFYLDFKLEPEVVEWEKILGKGKASFVGEMYTGDGYTLVLEEEHGRDYAIVGFDLKRDKGEDFTLQRYTLSVASSDKDLHRVWMPYYGEYNRDFVGLPRNVPPRIGYGLRYPVTFHHTCADRGIPIVFGMNRAGTVKLAVGFMDQRIETEIRFDNISIHPRSVPKGTMVFQMRRPMEGYVLGPLSEHKDAFFTCTNTFWFDAMQTYSRVHAENMNRSLQPSPDASWEPCWATFDNAPLGKWGTTHFLDSDEAIILQEVKIASKLGFKTLIFEPDWMGEAKKEWFTSLAYNWGFPDLWGDFIPNTRKFPDFVGMVRRIREIGMRTILWISPFLAGRESKVRQDLKEALIEVDELPSDPRSVYTNSYLCQRNPTAQKHATELVKRILKEYEVDGFKVDMLETSLSPCKAKHEHNFSSIGIAISHNLAKIKEAIDEVKKDAIIEFRQGYSNINNINYATAYRAADSNEQGEFDMNRRLCVMLRSYIPSGVAVHNDPVWWRKDESDENVAKMLSTQVICGVPQVVADLINMSDEHRTLVSRWLSFYQEHKEDFRHGKMKPIQNDPWFSTILVESGRKTFISHGNYPAVRISLNKNAEEIYIFNCTNEHSIYTILQNISGEFTAKIHDHTLTMVSESKLKARNKELTVDLDVPEGGYSTLKKTV